MVAITTAILARSALITHLLVVLLNAEWKLTDGVPHLWDLRTFMKSKQLIKSVIVSMRTLASQVISGHVDSAEFLALNWTDPEGMHSDQGSLELGPLNENSFTLLTASLFFRGCYRDPFSGFSNFSPEITLKQSWNRDQWATAWIIHHSSAVIVEKPSV